MNRDTTLRISNAPASVTIYLSQVGKAASLSPPATPTGLALTPVGSTEIDASWDASTGATSYLLERSPNGTTGWSTAGTPGTNSYNNTGLTPSTNYWYRVSATNTYGTSPPCTAVEGTTGAGSGAEDFWSEVYMPTQGVWIPTGSLDRWKAARALHASQLTEVVFVGNSTTEGSDFNGNSNSYLNTIRTLSQAVPYTDGGRGIFPVTDTSGASGETLSGINTAGSWTAPPDEANPLLGRGFNSSGAGAAIVFQGYGTKARILCMAQGSGGSFTWAANGGGTTTVTLAANEAKAVMISGLASTPNLISINNTGATRLDLTCEFLKTNGIVYHKHARFGAAAFSWWNPDNLAGPTDAFPLQLALGVKPGHASSYNGFDYGNVVDPNTAARKPSLVVIDLGLNDINLFSNTTGDYAHRDQIMMQQSIGGIIMMAKAVPADVLVIIPHLQYDASPYMAKYGIMAQQAIWTTAMAMNCAVVDFHVALGANGNIALTNNYIGAGNNPHLLPAGYAAQGTWLWNNCLSL